MLRIGLKFPCNGLNRVSKHGYNRFHLTTRHYETRVRARLDQDLRLFRNGKSMFKCPGAKYSDSSHPSQKSRGFAVPLILGSLGMSTGVLVYAKYDPQFRALLEQWVPGTDKAIQLMFLEDILGTNEPMGDLKTSSNISSIFGGGSKDKTVEQEPTKSASSPSGKSGKSLSQSVIDLEKSSALAASKAVSMYKEAASVIEEYNRYVSEVLESSGTTIDVGVWQRLRQETDRKKEIVATLEKHSEDALKSLKSLSRAIDEKRFETSPDAVNAATKNVTKMTEEVENARKLYEHTLKMGNVSEQYWSKVKAARVAFTEELQILFPHIKFDEKKPPVSDDAFDLFIVYMYQKVNNLQKDLEKMKTLGEAKLQSALRGSGDVTSTQKVEQLVEMRVHDEKRALYDQFSRKLLEEQKSYADKLRTQLKLQLQIHADHVKEVVAEKEREYKNELNRIISEQSMNEQAKHDMKYAAVVGRIRALESTLKGVLEEERKATNLQILWSSCQALVRALKHGTPGASPDETIKPLEPIIKAISKAAPKDDPLVQTAIESIPEVASKRGVYPECALRQRFLKVENVARKLALVPEEGASLPIYFLSYLQHLLVINSGYSISKGELQDAPIDPDSLNTYEILNRARYWIDQGDFKMSLRYMNLLKGASRSIAREWMSEVRILLETQQAVNIFNAYAGALGLMLISGDPVKPTEK